MLVVVGEGGWSMVIMTNIQYRYCETSYLIEEESKSVLMSDVTGNLDPSSCFRTRIFTIRAFFSERRKHSIHGMQS